MIRGDKNLSQLIYKIKYNPKHITSNVTNVLLKENIIPHTFLRYIFFNKQKFETQKIPQEVLWHEETHAKQKHSIDVLLIEMLQVLFWFNPLIHFTKNAIKLNHEFLADQGVLNKGITPKAYQQILLAFSAKKSESDLVSAINYSLIKKRFTIMKTQTSKRTLWLRSLILLPMLAFTLYSFSNRVEVEKKTINQKPLTSQDNNKIINTAEYNEASELLMKEYDTFIEIYKKTNIINASKYARAKVIYENLMSETQRLSAAKLPKIFNVNLSKVEKKRVVKAEYLAWKNKHDYALWLNGKVIENSELDKLSYTDIVYYTSSFIHKNARSKRFPQSHLVNLYTEEGFNESYKKSNLNEYNKLASEYSKKLKQFLNGNHLDNSELRILYHQGETLYEKISKENIKKYNIKPLAFVPANKNEAYQQKPQKKTSKKQTSYNVLKTPNKDIVLLDHWYITINNERYYYPYKGDIKKYYDKNGNEINLDVIQEYKDLYNRLEQLKNKAPHYVYKSKSEQEEMDRLYSDLGGMYFRTPRTEKYKIIKPENPLSPYVRLEKDGQVYYKKKGKLTEEEKAQLPKLPPPAPPTKFSSNEKSKGGPNNTYDIEGYNGANNVREEFLRKFKRYEALRYERPHFLKKSKADKKLMNDLWLELRQMLIYSLSKEDKKGLDYPKSPFLPYVRINYDGKSYYKINTHLTPEEEKATYTFGLKSPSDYSDYDNGLDLLKEDDPIVIPIGTYTLEPNVIEKEGNKRHITITVSKNGEYTINKDRNYKNFQKTSLAEIENLVANLSKKEIQNTFIFSRYYDYKKFRSKPAKTPEYQDDIEIILIKNDIRFPINEYDGKYKESVSYQLALENDHQSIKPSVLALVEIFKKYGVTNTTL